MTRGLLIVEAGQVEAARALALGPPFALSPEAVEALFVPAASLDGEEPASHWWASGEFTAEQWVAIGQLAAARAWAWCFDYNLRTEPGFPMATLDALGLQPLTREGVL